MQKNVLLEINRVREIMGLKLVIEQEDIVAGEAVDANAYKQVGGGQPYELFLEKSDATSKLYMESTGEETTVAQKFKYRRRHPHLVTIEKLETKIEGLDKNDRRYEDRVSNLTKKIEDYKQKYQKSLSNKRTDENYRYTNSKDSVKEVNKKQKSDNPYEENPEYVEGSVKLKVDVPLTPGEKVSLMEQIENYVSKNYDGDYTAAADTKKKSKKTRDTRYYGISSIYLRPKGVKIKEEEPEVAPKVKVYPGLASKLDGVDEGSKKVFKDNSWEVGEMIEEYAQGIIDDLNAMKQQYEEQGYDGVTFEMTTKGSDEKGNPIETPFTIATSASRIPNGGEARDLTFLELSEKRAQSTVAYLKQVWGAAGIKMIEPTIDFQGDGKKNKDGSTGGASGPEWTGRDADRPKYEASKYCKINASFLLKAPGFEQQQDPGDPGTPRIETVGEWRLQIIRRTKGRPGRQIIKRIGKIWNGLKSIRLPKISLPKRVFRKKMPCYGVQ